MKQYEESTALWDKVYSECELTDLSDVTLQVEPTFDACLDIFAKESKRVLDYGCGSGDILFECADYGYLEYGLGIDRSSVGIEYSQKMANYNHYKNLDFVVGDISYFSQMEDGSFDGIIVSNVLDVVPKDVEQNILQELTRLLNNDGLMFVKINPYASDKKLQEDGLKLLNNHLYEEDGILRLRNLHTRTWINEFKQNFILERYLEFPYPWQEGMNRLFLLRKKPSVQSEQMAG